jgi:hypothetical protein
MTGGGYRPTDWWEGSMPLKQRCHDIHNRFHTDWFKHSNVDRGDTQTARWSHKPTFFFFQNKESRLKSISYIQNHHCKYYNFVTQNIFDSNPKISKHNPQLFLAFLHSVCKKWTHNGIDCFNRGKNCIALAFSDYSYIFACHLLLAGFFLGLPFDHEDDDKMVLWNVWLLVEYTVLLLRRENSVF